MKKFLALLLVAVMCLSFAACDIDALMENDTGYAPNGLEYRINEDGKTCTIVGIGKCTDTVVEIPQTIKKYKVTAIGKEAFCVPAKQENEICVSITDFILPDGLVNIEESAFWGCSSLTKLVIPDSVVAIGISAFQECTGLESLTLSENLTCIPTQTACGCTSLQSIVIPKSVKTIDESAFLQSGLLQVNLYVGIEKLKDFSFHSLTASPTFYYEGTLEQWDKIAIGSGVVLDFENSFIKCQDAEMSFHQWYNRVP
jgi:hypothetical protein